MRLVNVAAYKDKNGIKEEKVTMKTNNSRNLCLRYVCLGTLRCH